jgi:hypothetical protein
MKPMFGSSFKPEPPPPPAGDVGGRGAACEWCMARLEGKALIQGFFCSTACAVAYFITAQTPPRADLRYAA